MKNKHDNSGRNNSPDVEIRKDSQDGAKGKDLSYLNEMPQMGGYEGLKAGAPPRKQKNMTQRRDNSMADES